MWSWTMWLRDWFRRTNSNLQRSTKVGLVQKVNFSGKFKTWIKLEKNIDSSKQNWFDKKCTYPTFTFWCQKIISMISNYFTDCILISPWLHFDFTSWFWKWITPRLAKQFRKYLLFSIKINFRGLIDLKSWNFYKAYKKAFPLGFAK